MFTDTSRIRLVSSAVVFVVCIFMVGCSSLQECVDDGICTPSELVARCPDCLADFAIDKVTSHVVDGNVELWIDVSNRGFEYLGLIPLRVSYETSEGFVHYNEDISLRSIYTIGYRSDIISTIFDQAHAGSSSRVFVSFPYDVGHRDVLISVNYDQTILERDYTNNRMELVVDVVDVVNHERALDVDGWVLFHAYDMTIDQDSTLSVLSYNGTQGFIRVFQVYPDTSDRSRVLFESDIFHVDILPFGDQYIMDVTAQVNPSVGYYIWYSESTQSTIYLEKYCHDDVCDIPVSFISQYLEYHPSSISQDWKRHSLVSLLPDESRFTRALSWSGDVPEWTKDRLVPFVWVTARLGFKNTDRMVDELAARPDGGKAIFFGHTVQASMNRHPDDAIIYIDSQGVEQTYGGVFNEYGVEALAKEYYQIYKEIYEKGGTLEYIILDYEDGRTNWHIGSSNTQEVEDRYRAIEEHPRFQSEVLDRLIEIGFNTSYGLLVDSVMQWRRSPNYLAWNAWRYEYEGAGLTQAVCEPAYEFFPDVTCSNYGFHAADPRYELRDRAGHFVSRFAYDGTVGTHQSVNFYGSMGQIRNTGLSHYQPNPFNSFRYMVNRARAMMLASPHPIQPWIACRDWREHNETPYQFVTFTDYWQEMIYHLLMTDVTELLFWNPAQANSCQDENEIYMHRTLAEFDEVVRSENAQWTVIDLAAWDKPFVSSSVIVQGQRGVPLRITRLTVNSPIAHQPGLFDESLVLVDGKGVTVKVEEYSVRFDHGEIYYSSDPTSVYGIWIIQPADTDLTIIS